MFRKLGIKPPGEIRWRKSGYGYQKVLAGTKLSYTKIWFRENHESFGSVVDRASNAKIAIRRIKSLESKHSELAKSCVE